MKKQEAIQELWRDLGETLTALLTTPSWQMAEIAAKAGDAKAIRLLPVLHESVTARFGFEVIRFGLFPVYAIYCTGVVVWGTIRIALEGWK
jgi:hypothetical protein